MSPEAVRLDKRLVELFDCSRGQARQYIENGWVKVDGVVVEQPQTPITSEQVELLEGARTDAIEQATMIFNKPSGMDPGQILPLITPATQRSDDSSGVRLLQRHFHQMQIAMPLPYIANGLVVVSQDGRMISHLRENARQLENEFEVDVTGPRDTWTQGKVLASLRTGPATRISWQSEQRLRVAGKGFDSAALITACTAAGLKVVALRRLRIGRIGLSKLPPLQWHYLPSDARF